MNISKAKNWAAGILKDAGVEEFRREAASLIGFVLRKDAAFMIAHSEYELSESEQAMLTDAVGRRAIREPFQYITGRQEFFGLEFEVTPDVLIPRPETEILVESAIEIMSGEDLSTLFEIGVGSGCISVSILHNVDRARATGVDISPAALSVAARNAEKHGVAERLVLQEADVFEGTSGTFDLIVSNPPYIPDSQLASLQKEVGSFEPPSALFAGAIGLDIIERIIIGAPNFLSSGGYLLIEIGFGQSAGVKELFDDSVWADVEFLSDLQGIPRIVKAHLRT